MKTFIQWIEGIGASSDKVLLYKIARGIQGGGMGVSKKAIHTALSGVFTGYEAVEGYGVSYEEWQQAKTQGIIIKDPQGHGWVFNHDKFGPEIGQQAPTKPPQSTHSGMFGKL